MDVRLLLLGLGRFFNTITLKPEAREIYPKYVSVYGARAGALYYFYNVAEELDEEGEWYLDRKTGDVYFWPWQGADRMDFSCCQEALLKCDETCNMTFEDLSLRCGTVAAIAAVGSNMTFTHLHVSDIRMNAVSIIGENNVISCSELCNLGAGGISLGGGEVNSLTHGNNAAVNNRIHDFGQLTQTAAPGISLAGVGNIAAHNEIYEAPHMAIFYAGNEHVIEYNDIHDTVKMSHDAGAIYAGRDMGGYGTIIRYNVLQRIGSEEFRPQGIYWDDAQCGQTAIGNVFIDVGCRAFLIGGGRDHVVKNNLIVRCGEGIQYDDRFREGHLFGGWYGDVLTEMQKKQISGKPRNEEPWISRYPSFAAVVLDENSDHDDPYFYVNPGKSTVCNNVILETQMPLNIADAVYRFSDVTDNFAYDTTETAGFDENARNLKKDSRVYAEHPAFNPIPVDEIGIQ